MARPDEKYRFEFTTTSTSLLKRTWKKRVIDLYSANTPNGKKISIMLEEIGFQYKVIKVDINNGEQFKEEFKKISPLSKIPVIIDHKNKKTIFESGAIMIHLAEKKGNLLPSDPYKRSKVIQWLMFKWEVLVQ